MRRAPPALPPDWLARCARSGVERVRRCWLAAPHTSPPGLHRSQSLVASARTLAEKQSRNDAGGEHQRHEDQEPPITDPSQPFVLRVVPHQRGLSVRLLSFTIWMRTLTLTARLGPAGPIPVGLSIGGVALIEQRQRGAILTEFAVTLVRTLFNEYADALRFHARGDEPRYGGVRNAEHVLTADGRSDQVDVSLVFDSTPEMGRHRVTLSNADGAVCWFSGELNPVTLQFAPGEELVAHASIAARRSASSNTRPSRSWRLRVQRGGTAVLRLGTRDPFRPQDRLELHVGGARLVR